jgi:GH15 family glucan-1,4-alpha-glucosidase
MTDLNLGLVGNCSYAALIDRGARVSWCCLPRFDGDPVFSSLLNGENPESGFFDIGLEGQTGSDQEYVRNTAILRTVLHDGSGGALEVIDFAPRFRHFGRMFRPNMLVRMLRPIAGTPRIRIRLRPTFGYNETAPQITRGSNHCRFVGPQLVMRLTTELPITYILDEKPFLLHRNATLILGPDESLTDGVETTAQAMYERTLDYWQEWTRGLRIPFEWQAAVIRAAITLKLCANEDTGAIVAAHTTSIPEAPGSQRNWDYRYCWLRDAYFVVHALNRLSATRTMEHHLRFIANIVAASEESPLQPVYGLALEAELEEREAPKLSGYRGMGPVRVGNLAWLQTQHDVYGSVILASAQSFFDERLARPGDGAMFERLERLGALAASRYDQPDAGLWELRNSKHVHTFSAAMCWAACDRLAKIARRIGRTDRAEFWTHTAESMRETILRRSWNPELNTFVSTFDGAELDASLLLLHEINFVRPTEQRFVATVDAIDRTLRRGAHLFRYVAPDDFGTPETAFNVCTFWHINALAAIGRTALARELFETMLGSLNHLGLLSEDIDPTSGILWGNFPQTYSMVGLITSAMRLSRRWEDEF